MAHLLYKTTTIADLSGGHICLSFYESPFSALADLLTKSAHPHPRLTRHHRDRGTLTHDYLRLSSRWYRGEGMLCGRVIVRATRTGKPLYRTDLSTHLFRRPPDIGVHLSSDPFYLYSGYQGHVNDAREKLLQWSGQEIGKAHLLTALLIRSNPQALWETASSQEVIRKAQEHDRAAALPHGVPQP